MERKFFIVVLLAFMICGCYSLRKKFVRKKKMTKKMPVYVDFKTYQEPKSQKIYEDYYLFACGWLEELIKSLNFTGNRKKQKQAIDEALMNIEQMMVFLNQEGKEELSLIYEELLKIKEKIYSPFLNGIEKELIVKEIEKILRKLHSQFSWSKIAKWRR